MKELNPRETGKFIARNSVDVTVVEGEIKDAASRVFRRMKEIKYSSRIWKEWPLHPKTMDEKALNWIFVIDTLNFSFWLPRDGPQFQVSYRGNTYEDYEALCACVNRALDEGIPLTTPTYYKDVMYETIRHVFRSCNGTTIPLLEERFANLQQTGKVLCLNFNGTFADVIKAGGKEVKKLIELITSHFSCFNDVGIFQGQTVQFHKRVQILLADVWACFEGNSYGEFKDISELTMFPDYRVPQSLLALKVITYSKNLMRKLKSEALLPYGEREEMEIRGCSIHAVELLREAVENLLESEDENIQLNSVLIDFYLWDFATQHPEEMTSYPEHRTRSIFY